MTVINYYESEMNRSISGEGKMINKGNIMVMTIKMALIFFSNHHFSKNILFIHLPIIYMYRSMAKSYLVPIGV